jgi:predicted metal-dependent hydrolase
MTTIQLSEIEIQVTQKEIKNLHLSVYPPEGKVKVSAPHRMSQETIRTFLISKLPWIRKQQKKIQEQPRETAREYLDRETHFFLGQRLLLKLEETKGRQQVIIRPGQMILQMRPSSTKDSREQVVEEFYRHRLREFIEKYIGEYEPRMGVKVADYGIKKMKTKWGTCNQAAKRIWINLELAKKPVNCLEYIIVHEMVHLLERSHNDRFKALMTKFMPKWRNHRDTLNKLPTKHEEWDY